MEVVESKLLPELRYLSAQDVNMRLMKTIIRYRGRLVFVQGCHEDLKVSLIDVKSNTNILAHSSDVDLDISSIELGWINAGKGACHVSRIAQNSQKQGVALNRTRVFAGWSAREPYTGYSWREIEDLRPFLALVGQDEYPTIRKACHGYGYAFDKDWAFSSSRPDPKTFAVYHKTIAIGTFNRSDGVFLLRRGYLTKTRRAQLLSHIQRSGISYVIKEQP